MRVDLIQILIVFGIVLGSMILHELAHGAMAYALGDRTAKEAGRLSLNPLKHLDPVMSLLVPMMLFVIGAPVFGGAKPVPVNSRNLKGGEWGMAAVAIAGPGMNFLIAFVGFLIGHFSGALYLGNYLGLAFSELVLINLGFMIFNLIPIPPLDGSRVLYVLMPDVVRGWMVKMESFGVMLVYLLILVFGSAFSALMVNGMRGILDFFYWIIPG